ncbi:MAG: hypothetical protein K5694_01240 [Bacilli bacterium]|nr:hypothetical protein [Bacilli bacterium]
MPPVTFKRYIKEIKEFILEAHPALSLKFSRARNVYYLVKNPLSTDSEYDYLSNIFSK